MAPAKTELRIDLDAGTVTCPAAHTVKLRTLESGQVARFGARCAACPLASQCPASRHGRSIHLGHHERQLAAAPARQADPDWKTSYTSPRPKIGHLMRRKHGGRHARVRGRRKVAADFTSLAAAVNLARFSVLGLDRQPAGQVISTA